MSDNKGPTKVHLLKAVVFLVVMYGCWELDDKQSWAPKHWCFWTVCWRRLLRVPWTARRSNQSILKEISPEYSLKGQMLKLKLLIFWPADAKNWLIWKDPDAGKDWRQEEKSTEDEVVRWHHWLYGHEFEQTLELVVDREAWCAEVHGVAKSQTWLSDWTDWDVWPQASF